VTGGEGGVGEGEREEEDYVVERTFGDGVIMVKYQTEITIEDGRSKSDVSNMESGDREDGRSARLFGTREME
jgi:hypothetical protein